MLGTVFAITAKGWKEKDTKYFTEYSSPLAPPSLLEITSQQGGFNQSLLDLQKYYPHSGICKGGSMMIGKGPRSKMCFR